MKSHIIIILLFVTTLYADANEHIDRINKELIAGRSPDALELFHEALTKYDANASLYFSGATISMKLDDLDQANKYYIKAIELAPKNKEYRNAQQELLELRNAFNTTQKTFDKGLFDDAILEYEKLTTIFSENAMVFYKLGRAYRYIQEYDDAVKNYKKAIELNPFEDKYVKAIKVISNDMGKKGDADYKIGEYDSAMSYYNKAIRYAPEYAPTYFKVANVYLRLQDVDKAIESLKEGLSFDSSYAKSYLMLGKLYKKKNNNKLAKESIDLALKIDSNYTKAYFELGQIYYNESNFDFAIKEYKNAIGSDSTYKKAYLTSGLCEMNVGNYANAESYYIKAINLDDRFVDAYYRLAEIYNLQKKHDKAKQIAKNAIYIKQNYAPAFHELGIAEMYLCNIVAAQDSFEKAKKDRNFRQSADTYLKDINYYTKDCN